MTSGAGATVHGTLYGAGLPAPGRAATASWDAEGVRVEFAGEGGTSEVVDPARLEVRRGGWRGEGLLLEWDVPGGRRALVVEDASPLLEHAASLPDPLRLQLADWSRQQRASRRVLHAWLVLVLVGIGLPVFGAAFLVLRSDRVADLAVRRVPLEWEAAWGDRLAAAWLADRPRWPEGPATRAVQALGRRLEATRGDGPFTVHWVLVQDPVANAFALPGGWVFVGSGLLEEVTGPEELAGVLAHEMQHVRERHSLRRLVHGLGLRMTFSMLWGGPDLLGGAAGEWAARFDGLRYSRAQERAADAGAVETLVAARLDPRPFADFLERVAGRYGSPPAFFRTHPGGRERARRVREALPAGTAAGPFEPAAIDWSAVQQELESAAPRSSAVAP